MILTSTIIPPSAPVTTTMEIKYLVARPDGCTQLFDSLCAPTVGDGWTPLHMKSYDVMRTVLIPVDPLTAIIGGLVTFSELQLPPAAEAFIKLVSPAK